MSDELKAIAHRFKHGPYHEWTTGNGGPGSVWHQDPQANIDAHVLATAHIECLDREAERALPITREWLESIGFAHGVHYLIDGNFMLSMDDDGLMLHAEGASVEETQIYRLPLPHITTRGHVLDFMRLLGVK